MVCKEKHSFVIMPQSFGKNTMSLRPEISGSAVRGNPLNIVGIASSRGLGTRNDNQSQFTDALRFVMQWLRLLNKDSPSEILLLAVFYNNMKLTVVFIRYGDSFASALKSSF